MQSETARVEAFSDGVFAIAITLLILDVHVPSGPAGHLGTALARQWPTYAAFLISFAFIGIMWENHHRLLCGGAGCLSGMFWFDLGQRSGEPGHERRLGDLLCPTPAGRN